jgi:serine protease Do
MGSIRTWSLAAVAAVLVVVVVHQRSSAQAEPTRSADTAVTTSTPAPTSSVATNAPVHVTGLPDFSDLVGRNGASVVNISVVEKAPKPGEAEGDDPLSQFFRHQMPNGMPNGHPQMPPATGVGSGFIVSSDGYILTNAHVVADAATVTVKLTDRREFTAKVIGVDKPSDIALIKIAATGLQAVQFGDSDKLRPGQWVIAIGSPFGFANSVTAGVVSAVGRPLPDENYVPFIQTDAAVNPGNSGGPLFNLDGQVVGINSQIYSRTGGYMGMSFAIPIDLALNVKEQLLRNGKVARSRIGVGVQPVNQQFAQSFGLTTPHGALVSNVEPESPSEKAGLQPGDVIVSVNGHPVDQSQDLPGLISGLAPGSEAKLGVWRDRKEKEVSVRTVLLDDQQAQLVKVKSDAQEDGGKLGLSLRPLAPEEQRQLHTRGRLVVEDVTGPALAAGVEAGDVVLGVNGAVVTSVADLKREVARGGHSVALLIQRDNAQMYLPLDLG